MNIFVELAYFIRDWWPLITTAVAIFISAYQGVARIITSLNDITRQLERLNDKLIESEKDRSKVWQQLETHDRVLDSLVVDMARTKDRVSENRDDIKSIERKVDKK